MTATVFDRFRQRQEPEPAHPPAPAPALPGRVMLDVLFEEKDEAKRRGARWDSAAQSWYAPAGADLARFREWLPPVLPDGPRCKVRVLALPQTCWRCGVETHAIVALMVDAQDLPRPSSEPGLVWFSDVAEALSVVLTPGALRHIGAGPLRRRFSRTAAAAYVSNGCRGCDALLGNVPLRVSMATYMNGGGDLEALAVGRVSIPTASLPDEWEPLCATGIDGGRVRCRSR